MLSERWERSRTFSLSSGQTSTDVMFSCLSPCVRMARMDALVPSPPLLAQVVISLASEAINERKWPFPVMESSSWWNLKRSTCSRRRGGRSGVCLAENTFASFILIDKRSLKIQPWLCVCVPCLCACVETWGTCWVSSSMALWPYFLRQGLPWALKPSISVRQAGQPALGALTPFSTGI